MDEATIDLRDVKEDVMRKTKTEAASEEAGEELDPAVAVYEKKPIEEIRAELRAHGIDPAPTIAAVKALIIDALRRRSDRRSDHLETFIAFLMLVTISCMAVPFARQT
jgi:hypothetical protein